MKKTNIKTETYALTGGFMIDIVTTDATYEAFLYHKKCGVKDLMFGCPKEQQPYEDFLELVEINADEYISDYAGEYMDNGYAVQLYVADRETGTFIEPVDDISDGIELIRQYEESDREDGSYTPDFYDIVTEDHCSVLVGG